MIDAEGRVAVYIRFFFIFFFVKKVGFMGMREICLPYIYIYPAPFFIL